MRLNLNDSFAFPVSEIPSARVTYAIQNKRDKNILLTTWGGIGDQICAEPTLRYALDMFKHEERVTLASDFPELFSHLKFHDVYDLRKEIPIIDDYLMFSTNNNHTAATTDPEKRIHKIDLPTQFLHSNLINCVDFPSIRAFRSQLPISYKQVKMRPPPPLKRTDLMSIAEERSRYVGFHCGKHWQSKTFPKSVWDSYLQAVKDKGFTPVLFGKEIAEHEGTVDTDTAGCIDLRNKTTLQESIWLLQNMACVITNDSSPLHMAATGDAWIGFIATAKHYDYITHWRKGGWSWRMQNLGLGGMWDIMDNCPNKAEDSKIDSVDPALLLSWLPAPEVIGNFCKEKMDEYIRNV